MSLRRSSSSSGRRALVAAGLAGALVAVPGTAAAAPATASDNPVDALVRFLESGAGGQLAPAAVPALPSLAVPPEIRDAFQQLADVAMLPENCVDGVADAIELILNGLIALPLELADVLAELLELLDGGVPGLPELPLGPLQDLLDQLLGGLGGLTGVAPPATDAAAVDGTAPDGTAPDDALPDGTTPGSPELPTLIDGLLALGAALEGCLPTGGEEPPAETPAPTPVATPSEQPPAATPAPHTPAPVAQPVAYLGYAPTGADAARADDTSLPLTAVAGGLVLLAGAGAAGYGMRGRAVRARD